MNTPPDPTNLSSLLVRIGSHKSEAPSFEEQIKQIKDVHEIQERDGNWSYSEYTLGAYNTLEWVVSIIDNREPIYKTPPGVYLCDTPNGLIRTRGILERLKPHELRVVGEQVRLNKMLWKLKDFRTTDLYKHLDVESQGLLENQEVVMYGYNKVLIARILGFIRKDVEVGSNDLILSMIAKELSIRDTTFFPGPGTDYLLNLEIDKAKEGEHGDS